MIKVIVSGRASILGNPSDGYGGAVISCSIKNRAITIIKPAEILILRNHSGSIVLTETADFENREDHFDIPRVVLRYLKLYKLKAEIIMETAIPEQAGLAGSTALIFSVLKALLKYIGTDYNQYNTAELIRHLEYHYMRCQCGYQDAYMTVFGGLNYIDFRGKEHYQSLKQESFATVEPLHEYITDLPFIVAHSGLKHHSGQFHTPARQRWLEGDLDVINTYNEIASLAREGKKAWINKDWQSLAKCMNENHRLQDRIAYSGDENNRLIKVAKDHGALAAKLAGAGGGGTIIALTLDAEKTKRALIDAGVNQFIELDPVL